MTRVVATGITRGAESKPPFTTTKLHLYRPLSDWSLLMAGIVKVPVMRFSWPTVTSSRVHRYIMVVPRDTATAEQGMVTVVPEGGVRAAGGLINTVGITVGQGNKNEGVVRGVVSKAKCGGVVRGVVRKAGMKVW